MTDMRGEKKGSHADGEILLASDNQSCHISTVIFIRIYQLHITEYNIYMCTLFYKNV